MRRIVTAVVLVVALLVPASTAFGFHGGNEPVGSKRVSITGAFIDDPSNQPPQVSGEPVTTHQWMDSKGNDDGFVCQKDTSGRRVIVDNSGSV